MAEIMQSNFHLINSCLNYSGKHELNSLKKQASFQYFSIQIH